MGHGRKPDWGDKAVYWGYRLCFSILRRIPQTFSSVNFVHELGCEGGPADDTDSDCLRFGTHNVHFAEPPCAFSTKVCARHAQEWRADPRYEGHARRTYWRHADVAEKEAS